MSAGDAIEIVLPEDRRRLSLPSWRVALALLAFCAVYALTENLGRNGTLPSATQYLANLRQAVMVFFAALLAIWIAAALAPHRRIVRPAALTVAVILGITVGYAIARGPGVVLDAWYTEPLALAPVSRFAGIGLLGVALFLMAERNEYVRRALHIAGERRSALERATAEARLAVLRGQIEPHFLFNTLAHVRRLYAVDRLAGRAMLRNLVRYMGDARPALERQSLTLAEDAKLAEAYLSLQQVRMGARLSFTFDLPPETRTALVPPMALTTLVENSIEHALSPLPAGGVISVRAAVNGASIRIDVVDNGRGLKPGAGSGVGLANLRARLSMLHGPAATLALRQNPGAGVTATMIVPHERRGARRDA